MTQPSGPIGIVGRHDSLLAVPEMFVNPRPSTAARLALVGAVVAGLLLATALAASPQLHAWLHHHGDESEHVCLAATLQSGGIEEILVVIMAVEPMAEVVATAPVRDLEVAESFFLSCRVLEHAPPHGLLS